MNEKLLLPAVLVFNIVTLIWFTQNNQWISLFVCRAFTGIFQETNGIYFPVWVDVYASEAKKSSWMSIIMIGATTGNLFGYIMAASLQDLAGWRISFYI